ncbi:hypothetical protein DEO72_LG9g1807 [Vigna unguiculata]|uniref:Uncharacterized protein n=1 Tax=Vigna unguiculata TaxID=3917 RepID=A0A4D6MZ58_VIGUN|nr:hypothetical protein DEO72_LG9g1807 [Vigna unguiculata]
MHEFRHLQQQPSRTIFSMAAANASIHHATTISIELRDHHDSAAHTSPRRATTPLQQIRYCSAHPASIISATRRAPAGSSSPQRHHPRDATAPANARATSEFFFLAHNHGGHHNNHPLRSRFATFA